MRKQVTRWRAALVGSVSALAVSVMVPAVGTTGGEALAQEITKSYWVKGTPAGGTWLTPRAEIASAPEPAVMPVVFPSASTLVRFTGTLGPVDEDVGHLATLTVSTGSREWLFTLRDVDTLTYTANPDWMILNDIFPPNLEFKGSPALLRAVDAAARTGTPVRVRGRLYIDDGTLLVTSVTPVRPPA